VLTSDLHFDHAIEHANLVNPKTILRSYEAAQIGTKVKLALPHLPLSRPMESGRLQLGRVGPHRDLPHLLPRSGGEEKDLARRGYGVRWSTDARRLFYRSGDRVMRLEALDDRWTSGQPEVFVGGIDGFMAWDVAPDGRAVIALEAAAGAAAPSRAELVR
jgi:hypothetical protein